MTIVKIHDSQWFKKHCKVLSKTDNYIELIPKYFCWDSQTTGFVSWLSGDSDMSRMEGKVLKVEYDDDTVPVHKLMCGSRYQIKGFWIPNWAIEWVKEE